MSNRSFLRNSSIALLLLSSGCSSTNAPLVDSGVMSDSSVTKADASMGTLDAGDAASTGTADASDAAPASSSDGGFAGPAPLTGLAGTAARPMLTDGQASEYLVLEYLAKAGDLPSGLTTDNWNPTAGLGDVSAFAATYTVMAGGTYPTVQSAVDAAVAAGGTNRAYILVSPGTYREVVCVPQAAPPITLYSTNADATQTTIVFGNYNGLMKTAGTPANPCTMNASAVTYGTAGSATFSAFGKGFQAKNITFSNDVSPATVSGVAGSQGVALMTQADQVILENVRVLGHQDSLYLESPNGATVVRTYVKDSYIAGDVDYIFGAATSVIDHCTIQFVSDRTMTGQVLAPDTDARNPYGILVINGHFTADSTTVMGIGLGRAWDHSCVDVPTYLSSPNCVAATNGSYPNGQAVVRSSMLDAHISTTTPWKAAATTKRGFSTTPWMCSAPDGAPAGTCPANRLYEYQDTP
ncbi:MAG: pectinesterase family protein [Myxococcota bacterium]|nr:pectinesterase family protein [Myxococcota bacterium]